MTNNDKVQKLREDIKLANSKVVGTFRELKESLKDAAYAYDKANKMMNEDVNLYIELRNDLEKMFDKYSKLYAAVEKQTDHVGF